MKRDSRDIVMTYYCKQCNSYHCKPYDCGKHGVLCESCAVATCRPTFVTFKNPPQIFANPGA